MPNRGGEHFRDYDGLLTAAKYEDEVLTFVWDLTDELASGETISSVSYDAQNGLTISAQTATTTTITFTLTNSGTLEVTATLSTGRKVQERFAWQARDEGESDYS